MLISYLNVIGGAINKVPNSDLIFQSGEPNILAESRDINISGCSGELSGAFVIENSDIAWDDLRLKNEHLWVPEVYSFNFPLSWNVYTTLRDNKNAFIEFIETQQNHTKC